MSSVAGSLIEAPESPFEQAPEFIGAFPQGRPKSPRELESELLDSIMAIKATTGTSTSPRDYSPIGSAFSTLRAEQLEHTIAEGRRRLLALEEGWDGESGSGYQERTIDYAVDYLRLLCRVSGVAALERVRIRPGNEGGVDLHWRVDEFELLITFKPDGSVLYYGDDYQRNLIQGESMPDPNFLDCWMEHLSR